MSAASVPIRFVVGSRRLFAVPRRLHPVGHSLEQAIAGSVSEFPPLDDTLDGYRIMSLPAAALGEVAARFPRCLVGGLQHYRRHYIAMEGGYDAYLAGFSGKTRSTLGRKRRKFASLDAKGYEVAEFRTPAEIEAFFAEALPLSRRTYQARLLDAGLPEGEAALAEAREHAAQDRLRAFVLRLAGEAVAYLYLPVVGDTLVYAHLGYDPAFAAHSPGTVLQMEALERLFGEHRFRYFDFTEGEGAHKALFGTDSVAACSFFLLRPSAGNRLLIGSLNLFDGGIALSKRIAGGSSVVAAARRRLRG